MAHVQGELDHSHLNRTEVGGAGQRAGDADLAVVSELEVVAEHVGQEGAVGHCRGGHSSQETVEEEVGRPVEEGLREVVEQVGSILGASSPASNQQREAYEEENEERVSEEVEEHEEVVALTDPEVAGKGKVEGNQKFNNFEKQVGAAEHDEFLGNAELEAATDAPQSGEEVEETQEGEQTGHAK